MVYFDEETDNGGSSIADHRVRVVQESGASWRAQSQPRHLPVVPRGALPAIAAPRRLAFLPPQSRRDPERC
jgi:hypothetical protein